MLIAGHGLLEAALLVAALFGLAPLLQGRLVFSMISVVGALILLWMAVGMLRGVSQLEIPMSAVDRRGAGSAVGFRERVGIAMRLFGAGILLRFYGRGQAIRIIAGSKITSLRKSEKATRTSRLARQINAAVVGSPLARSRS